MFHTASTCFNMFDIASTFAIIFHPSPAPSMRSYTDDGASSYRNVCKMITTILDTILLLKLSSKTHDKGPMFGNF